MLVGAVCVACMAHGAFGCEMTYSCLCSGGDTADGYPLGHIAGQLRWHSEINLKLPPRDPQESRTFEGPKAETCSISVWAHCTCNYYAYLLQENDQTTPMVDPMQQRRLRADKKDAIREAKGKGKGKGSKSKAKSSSVEGNEKGEGKGSKKGSKTKSSNDEGEGNKKGKAKGKGKGKDTKSDKSKPNDSKGSGKKGKRKSPEDPEDPEPSGEPASPKKLGCGKCRYLKGGCAVCRNPNFRPRGPRGPRRS